VRFPSVFRIQNLWDGSGSSSVKIVEYFSVFRIRPYISVWIQIRFRIQGAKPMRIHADPVPDPGHTLKQCCGSEFNGVAIRLRIKEGKKGPREIENS
jgi:hypothetical protein